MCEVPIPITKSCMSSACRQPLSLRLSVRIPQHARHASAAARAGVLGGVVVYTFHDIHFTVLGYVWIAVWYAFAVFEMVYVKVVVDSVQMTTWSRTYYQARAAPPGPCLPA